MDRTLLTPDEIAAALDSLDGGWDGSPARLTRSVEFADFPTAVQFIDRVAAFAEELDHHPDLDLRWRRVHIALSTHSAGGVTAFDVRLAGIVDEIVEALPLA